MQTNISVSQTFILGSINKSPPPLYPSGIVLALSAGDPRFNPPTRTTSYQRRYKNGTRSSLVWHSTLKREILALSEEVKKGKTCNG